MKGQSKSAMLNKLVQWFINKYGYDTPVELKNPIDFSNGSYVGTPSITKIKVVSGDTSELKAFPYKRLHFCVGFYGEGWTDDTADYWSKEWKGYLYNYGMEALADTLDLEIVTSITYNVKEKKK